MARDDFSAKTKGILARRVALKCSRPECGAITSGPSTDPDRAINTGVAAHVTAASPGGPRYDPLLTRQQRRSVSNGIWLCANCSVLIDSDVDRFPASTLHEWRTRAEERARRAIGATALFRPIEAAEVRQELSLGQALAVRALEEEFGCHVETELHVEAGEGWLRLDAAVVRGEDLVAIEINEDHGRGIPYFQIEYLLDLIAKLKFRRFRGCVVICVVVSDGPEERDGHTLSRLQAVIEARPTLDVSVRHFRLERLRNRFKA